MGDALYGKAKARFNWQAAGGLAALVIALTGVLSYIRGCGSAHVITATQVASKQTITATQMASNDFARAMVAAVRPKLFLTVEDESFDKSTIRILVRIQNHGQSTAVIQSLFLKLDPTNGVGYPALANSLIAPGGSLQHVYRLSRSTAYKDRAYDVKAALDKMGALNFVLKYSSRELPESVFEEATNTALAWHDKSLIGVGE